MSEVLIETCTSLKEYTVSLINIHKKENKELKKFLDIIDCKRRSKRIVSDLGINSPKHHKLFEEFESFDTKHLPAEFVVKPCWGDSNRGIRICKLENERIFDLQNNISYSSKEFLFSYYSESNQFSNYSKEFTIEERILPDSAEEIFPFDYKIYTANGKAICFMQRNINNGPNSTDWRYKYWLRNGTTIESVNSKLTYDSNLALPKNWQDLISAADKIAQHLPIPFIRIDLFINKNGVYFCELTPKPGTYKTYNSDFDEFVGRQIKKALPWNLESVREFLDKHHHLIW